MSGKQAFPPSITGNGSEPAGSVLDHTFGAGEAVEVIRVREVDPRPHDVLQARSGALERRPD